MFYTVLERVDRDYRNASTNSSVKFSANDQMYKELDGVAMGSLLGPTLANIFVGSKEAVLLEKMSRPLFYCMYVDDCFPIFKTKDESI